MLTILLQKARKYRKWAQLRKPGEISLDEYYFAYGANVDPDRFKKNHMHFNALGSACLKGYKLDFSLPCQFHRMGFGSVAPADGKEVWGTLYQMDKLSLELLDILEFVAYGYYRRIKLPVQDKESWVYVAAKPRADLIPSSEYLGVIIRNSKKAGHPASFIDYLQTIPHQPKDKFELNLGFRITQFEKLRPFVKLLGPLYLKHDKLRQKLMNFLP